MKSAAIWAWLPGLNSPESRKTTTAWTGCDPAPGAGIACYSGSVVTHVAIVVEIDGALHAVECNPRTNVTFLPLARFARRFVRVEYYQ